MFDRQADKIFCVNTCEKQVLNVKTFNCIKLTRLDVETSNTYKTVFMS